MINLDYYILFFSNHKFLLQIAMGTIVLAGIALATVNKLKKLFVPNNFSGKQKFDLENALPDCIIY